MRAGIELVDVLDRLGKNRKRCKPKEVELDEADVFNVLFVKLTDRIFGVTIRVVERTKIGEFSRRNQDAPCVHA